MKRQAAMVLADDPLEESLAILAAHAAKDGGSLSDLELARFRERVNEIRREYRQDVELSAGTDRPGAVLKELRDIETACRELANKLAGASTVTLDILHGNSRTPLIDALERSEADKKSLFAVRLLTSRYDLQFGTFDHEPAMREIVEDLVTASVRRLDDNYPIAWPVAVLALAERCKLDARHFEKSWKKRRRRQRDVLNHGPSGWLGERDESSPEVDYEASALPNRPSDAGGELSLFKDQRGDPRWNLVRECWAMLAEIHDPIDRAISGHATSRLSALARAMFRFADGGDPDGKGIGLPAYVQNAAKIMGERHKLLMRLADSAMKLGTPFSEDDRERLVSLGEALRTGRVPKWLRDLARLKTPPRERDRSG